jgi:hypothetical protein
MGFMPKCNLEHFFGRSHFQIERQIGGRHYAFYVGIANVSPVFAQMGSNAITADGGDNLRRTHRVWMRAAARVANGGNMVNVDA